MSDKPDAVALRKLIAAHPEIFRGDGPRVWSHLPPGWYGILDQLCLGIESILGADIERFRVEQIKQKYGTLRVYYSIDGRAKIAIDITAPGSRTRVQERSEDRPSVRIDALIDAAEEESARTCEECGAPGLLRQSGRGWLRTTCETHAEPGGRIVEEGGE